MDASMHFWQKMWPQIVDDASTNSFMQTGQLNFGSFETSLLAGAWIACVAMGSSDELIKLLQHDTAEVQCTVLSFLPS